MGYVFWVWVCKCDDEWECFMIFVCLSELSGWLFHCCEIWWVLSFVVLFGLMVVACLLVV